MTRLRMLSVASLALALAACSETPETRVSPSATEPQLVATPATIHREYGRPQRIGNGKVRTYITVDQKNRAVPLEVGVALDETAMYGLPTIPMPMPMDADDDRTTHGHDHSGMTVILLDLPEQNPTPYRFVQFDWNPNGHEPAGVYDLPHFDFHFYTVPVEVRNSILPSDPSYATKAASFPGTEFRAPFYIDAATAAHIPPALATVPQMGLHWLDVRSPELQMLTGHPEAYKPFTKTFIYGSWNGAFIFDEPMITRDYIMAKKSAIDPTVVDEIIPVPTAPRYAPKGYYPNAYRILYDASAKEYRIALTQLTLRD
jgi:hypothetical protein